MSESKPSLEPVPVLLEAKDRSAADDSVAAGLVGMAYLARQAFEEKRRRQCLEITDAILKIEPNHPEARTIQSSVRTELERDFELAQTILKDAQMYNDRALYEHAAAVLRRIVAAEPDNLVAQSLLNETVAAGFFCQSAVDDPPERRINPELIWTAGCFAFVALFAVLALRGAMSSRASAQAAAVPRVSASSEPPRHEPATVPLMIVEQSASSPVHAALTDPKTASTRPQNSETLIAAATKPPIRTAAAPAVPETATAMGSLAISSAVPVEIYRGQEHLGSTPATLQLPAGSQTLEYRYQGARQILTHQIRSQETTTAAVSFPTRVQLNAKPWAQVFLDGVQLTPIGQTPLGDVSVPIGSVLVFQNPSFPEKRYRVTARDAAITVTFP